MKKLMIAAAIVCVAVISQAATFNWQTTGGIKDENGNFNNEYIGFGFIGSSSLGEDSGIKTWSVADAVALVMAGGDDLWAYAMPATEEYRYGYNDGGLSIGSVTETGAAADEKLSGFIIVVNTDQEGIDYNPTKYSVVDGGALVNVGNVKGDYTFALTTQGEWQSVPEPTSGLLLLLGVAGLALRRRRA